MPASSLIVSVDRVEGKVVVLEGDDGRRFEVPIAKFADRPEEGMIYRVPLDKSRKPRWSSATVDPGESDKRRKHLSRRVDKLRDADRGGDVEL